MSTPNLDLPTSPSGPSNLSVAHNDAMQIIDAMVPLIVVDHTLTAPPTTVSGDEGKRWIVASPATDVWAGHENDIALCTAPGLWKYLTPNSGWRGKSLINGLYYSFDGAAWTADAGVSIQFSDIAGSPSDNAALAAELANKLEVADIAGKADTSYVDEVVTKFVGLNDQTGTAYTLALTDAGKDVRCTNAAAIALTVPAEAVVAFPVGTLIAFSQGDAGAVTATSDGTTVIRAPNGATTTAQYDARMLEYLGSDEWRVW